MEFIIKLDRNANDAQIKQYLQEMMEREIGIELVFYNYGLYRGFWIYWYQSKAYVTTNNELEALFGNAPIAVDCETFDAYVTGTADETHCYIDRYLDSQSV